MTNSDDFRASTAANEEADSALVAAAGMDEPEGVPATASAKDEPEDALATAEKIDEFFATAKQEQAAKYGPAASIMLETLNRVDQFTGVDFVRSYRTGKIYPEDRLRELVLRFTDVRLQQWYVKFDAAMANEHYYGPIHADPNLADSANLTISLMAATQSIIGRSRIAWEKLMRAVYYLETGGDLQPSASRSYKGKFFSWVADQPKWRFLEPYKSVVDEHDDRFRNGEFHKGSVLRRVVLGHEMPDLNQIMELSNFMMNGIWVNILDIVQGNWPSHFTNLHWASESQMEIDPRYLPPEGDETRAC